MDRRHFLATSVAGLLAAPAVHAYEVPEHLLPQGVRLRSKHTVGQIIVSPSTHFLYLITAPRRAIRYGVGVGKAGLNYKGSAVIGRKVVWPGSRISPLRPVSACTSPGSTRQARRAARGEGREGRAPPFPGIRASYTDQERKQIIYI